MVVIDAILPYLLMGSTAFLAATILPFASEAALAAQIKAGFGSTGWLVFAASAGNVGGSVFNWWIGQALRRFEGRRWFPFKPADVAKATDRFNAYGVWILLLAWLPIIGDPLTLVAGVLRVPLWIFVPLVAIGKCARYIVVAWLV